MLVRDIVERAYRMNVESIVEYPVDALGLFIDLACEVERLRALTDQLQKGEKLWLWRDGEGRFLAFRSLFPTMPDSADPAILGQPSGYAFYHRMTLAEAQEVSREVSLGPITSPSPTTGQLFSAANGVTYRFDGTLWLVQPGRAAARGFLRVCQWRASIHFDSFRDDIQYD
jgi:hypothetical protein